jgi:leader peptidase (prepilin peptidase)/N-methyltransferase
MRCADFSKALKSGFGESVFCWEKLQSAADFDKINKKRKDRKGKAMGQIDAATGVVIFIIGTILGSFIACVADRLSRGENPWRGQSHCDTCGHGLAPADLVPVLAYLRLRGRCRYCGSPIPRALPFAEIAFGAVAVVIAQRFGWSWTTLKVLGFAGILMAVALMDLKTTTIADGLIAAGIVWWLVTAPLTLGAAWQAVLADIGGALALAAVLWLVARLFERRTGRRGLGGGDIKLCLMAGLYVGVWALSLFLLLACGFGLVFAAATRQRKIPFGPAIALSAVFCVLAGGPVVTALLTVF